MAVSGTGDAGRGAPHIRSWRTTTAVRVFALALVAGALISDGVLVETTPPLILLASVAGVSSFLEWITRSRTSHWHSVAEALIVTTLVLSASDASGIQGYLAVPPVVAGVRHGLVATLNVFLLSVTTLVATLALDPSGEDVRRAAGGLTWLAMGLGVGILASWQTRSTRDLVARQAPHAAAHSLMARLHHLATSGDVPLDSATLAAELDERMRRATGCARSAIFVLDSTGAARSLNPTEDVARLAREIEIPDIDRTPGAAVVPLRGAREVLGHCVLVGVPRWTPEAGMRAAEIADDFAVRLETAVLFDEIRSLAASEERNRIARDMHDGVAQEIVALGYVVDEIESVSQEAFTRQLAGELRQEISRVVTELRHSIFDLRHRVTEQDLTTALTDYVQEVNRDTGLRVHLVLDSGAVDVPTRVQDELMRIAQEAIANVRRHARATNLWVTLVADGPTMRMEIVDDGIGNATPRDRHWGLQTMRERAGGIGADLEITGREGGGTVVRLVGPQVPSTSTRGKASA